MNSASTSGMWVLGVLVAFFGLIAFFFFYEYVVKPGRRKRALSDVAHRFPTLTFCPTAEHFRQASGLYGESLQGTFDDVSVTVCNWLTKSSRSATWHTYYEAQFPVALPPGVVLRRQGIWASATKLVGAQDIQVGVPEFDRVVMIQGPSEAVIQALFSRPETRQAVMEAFAEFPQLEINAGQAQVEQTTQITKAETVISRLQVLTRLAHVLAEAARHQFRQRAVESAAAGPTSFASEDPSSTAHKKNVQPCRNEMPRIKTGDWSVRRGDFLRGTYAKFIALGAGFAFLVAFSNPPADLGPELWQLPLLALAVLVGVFLYRWGAHPKTRLTASPDFLVLEAKGQVQWRYAVAGASWTIGRWTTNSRSVGSRLLVRTPERLLVIGSEGAFVDQDEYDDALARQLAPPKAPTDPFHIRPSGEVCDLVVSREGFFELMAWCNTNLGRM